MCKYDRLICYNVKFKWNSRIRYLKNFKRISIIFEKLPLIIEPKPKYGINPIYLK
jgi:hypothetical protein